MFVSKCGVLFEGGGRPRSKTGRRHEERSERSTPSGLFVAGRRPVVAEMGLQEIVLGKVDCGAVEGLNMGGGGKRGTLLEQRTRRKCGGS